MSNQEYTTPIYPEDEKFSLQKQLQKLWEACMGALLQWRFLSLATLLGALIGTGYAFLKPVQYTARFTFVVEESKMSGGSLASALAGQLGFDIGGMAGGSSGVLAGDNVLELVKSHTLIRKTLLTAYDNTGKTLADQYAAVYKYTKKWEGSGGIEGPVSFPADPAKRGRTQDSLLQILADKIITNSLSIAKPDKKLGFFEFIITSKDEKFSLLFSQRLLKMATDFYVETKTRRLVTNVKRLQLKADSLNASLNRKTTSAANANRLLLDANPVYAEQEVSAEISKRDKVMQSTIYAEIVKNLEISKTALIQETPTIQVVDEPELPLKDNKTRISIAALAGALAGFGVLFMGLVAFRRD